MKININFGFLQGILIIRKKPQDQEEFWLTPPPVFSLNNPWNRMPGIISSKKVLLKSTRIFSENELGY